MEDPLITECKAKHHVTSCSLARNAQGLTIAIPDTVPLPSPSADYTAEKICIGSNIRRRTKFELRYVIAVIPIAIVIVVIIAAKMFGDIEGQPEPGYGMAASWILAFAAIGIALSFPLYGIIWLIAYIAKYFMNKKKCPENISIFATEPVLRQGEKVAGEIGKIAWRMRR